MLPIPLSNKDTTCIREMRQLITVNTGWRKRERRKGEGGSGDRGLPGLKTTATRSHVLYSLETLQGSETRGKGWVGVQGLHISCLGSTPDLPVGVLAVPDKLLDNDVLDAILFLGGGDLSSADESGHGLSGT